MLYQIFGLFLIYVSFSFISSSYKSGFGTEKNKEIGNQKSWAVIDFMNIFSGFSMLFLLETLLLFKHQGFTNYIQRLVNHLIN